MLGSSRRFQKLRTWGQKGAKHTVYIKHNKKSNNYNELYATKIIVLRT